MKSSLAVTLILSIFGFAFTADAADGKAPAWVRDIEAIQSKLQFDSSGRPISFPGCDDPTTIKILREEIENEPVANGKRIKVLTINDPRTSWDSAFNKQACSAIATTKEGAVRYIYRFDWDKGGLGFMYYQR